LVRQLIGVQRFHICNVGLGSQFFILSVASKIQEPNDPGLSNDMFSQSDKNTTRSFGENKLNCTKYNKSMKMEANRINFRRMMIANYDRVKNRSAKVLAIMYKSKNPLNGMVGKSATWRGQPAGHMA
uniref:Uncharacterized protein n=1 Tax=Romanomermis culicivorax TaxID=13658 RepID=A0A915IWI0_ROMCU